MEVRNSEESYLIGTLQPNLNLSMRDIVAARCFALFAGGYMLLGSGARELGAPGLLALFLGVLISLGLTSRVRPSIPAILLSGLAVCYVILSKDGVLPQSWTREHRSDLLARQAIMYIMIPFFLAAGQNFWNILFAHRARCKKYVLLTLVITMTVTPLIDSHFSSTSTQGILLPNLINSCMLSLLLIAWLLFVTMPYQQARWMCAPVTLILIILAQNAQTALAAVFLSVVFYSNKGILAARMLALVVMTTVLVTIIAGPQRIAELDVNTAVRVVDWTNALKAVYDTSYLGVGFGTESVQNYYPALERGGQVRARPSSVCLYSQHIYLCITPYGDVRRRTYSNYSVMGLRASGD